MKFKICGIALGVAFVISASGVFAQENTCVAETACKYDEFAMIPYGDAAARMNILAQFMHNRPGLLAYIAVFAGCDELPGIGRRYANRLKNMVVALGIKADRVTAIDGGRRDKQTTTIWLVPPGVEPPISTKDPAAEPFRGDQSVKYDEYPIQFDTDTECDCWDGRFESPEARLDGVAALMKAKPELRVRIIGRAQAVYVRKAIGKKLPDGTRKYIFVRSRKLSDPSGTDRNLATGEKKYLVARHGIQSSRILAVGGGYHRLVNMEPEILTAEEAVPSIAISARTIELQILPLVRASVLPGSVRKRVKENNQIATNRARQ